jgi:hypothetical protein
MAGCERKGRDVGRESEDQETWFRAQGRTEDVWQDLGDATDLVTQDLLVTLGGLTLGRVLSNCYKAEGGLPGEPRTGAWQGFRDLEIIYVVGPNTPFPSSGKPSKAG